MRVGCVRVTYIRGARALTRALPSRDLQLSNASKALSNLRESSKAAPPTTQTTSIPPHSTVASEKPTVSTSDGTCTEHTHAQTLSVLTHAQSQPTENLFGHFRTTRDQHFVSPLPPSPCSTTRTCCVTWGGRTGSWAGSTATGRGCQESWSRSCGSAAVE
jgi:hypothetical protein